MKNNRYWHKKSIKIRKLKEAIKDTQELLSYAKAKAHVFLNMFGMGNATAKDRRWFRDTYLAQYATDVLERPTTEVAVQFATEVLSRASQHSRLLDPSGVVGAGRSLIIVE